MSELVQTYVGCVLKVVRVLLVIQCVHVADVTHMTTVLTEKCALLC